MIDTMQNINPIDGVMWDRQSHRNILYLLLSFPLGLFYFNVLLAGITLGIPTLSIWIGIPILLVFINICWHLAMFERHMAIQWLRVEITPIPTEAPTPIFSWRSLPVRLSNPMTWKMLAYLLLKLPLGLCSFIITGVLLALSLAIMIVGLVLGCITAPFFILIGALQHVPEPWQHLRQYLLFALTGFGLNILTFHLLNGLAFLEGQ